MEFLAPLNVDLYKWIVFQPLVLASTTSLNLLAIRIRLLTRNSSDKPPRFFRKLKEEPRPRHKKLPFKNRNLTRSALFNMMWTRKRSRAKLRKIVRWEIIPYCWKCLRNRAKRVLVQQLQDGPVGSKMREMRLWDLVITRWRVISAQSKNHKNWKMQSHRTSSLKRPGSPMIF